MFFDELRWRICFLTYGWWVLTNDQRTPHTLGFDFGKRSWFRWLLKISVSIKVTRATKKVDKLLIVGEQSGCTTFKELNFNSYFRWFRAIRFRSQTAHGIIWWLLILSTLSSSISLALSSFKSGSKLSRSGTISYKIVCNSLHFWWKSEQASAFTKCIYTYIY